VRDLAPRVEPEPNRYADIGERNSRVSIVVYATLSENNSSYVCDQLKEVMMLTRGIRSGFCRLILPGSLRVVGFSSKDRNPKSPFPTTPRDELSKVRLSIRSLSRAGTFAHGAHSSRFTHFLILRGRLWLAAARERLNECGAALECRAALLSREMRNLLCVSSPCRPCRRQASPASAVFPSAIRQPWPRW
jgi:hypothetical protein